MGYYEDWIAPNMIDCEQLIQKTHDAYENRHIGWTTKDGELIPYSKMSTSHLINCKRLIERTNFRAKFLSYINVELKRRGVI